MTDSAHFTARAAELRASAEDVLTRVTRQAQALDAVKSRSGTVQGSATSPDGQVHAVVDSTGMLVGLTVAGRPDLGPLIVDTVRTAAGRARGEVRALYQGLVTDGLIKKVPEHVPDAPPQLATPPTPPPVRPRRVADEPEDEQPAGFQRDAW
ncbi:hypothetical protein ACFWN2_12680 [Lentzea sp. NPDC058436]|uniref:hypothetical protein n=1 Tax=Lentzea sp. NPDC058436 TaxID=3346499 RepID=UPI00365373A9